MRGVPWGEVGFQEWLRTEVTVLFAPVVGKGLMVVVELEVLPVVRGMVVSLPFASSFPWASMGMRRYRSGSRYWRWDGI